MENSRLLRTTVYELTVGIIGLLVSVLYIPHVHHHNWLYALLLLAFATVIEGIPVPVGKAVGTLTIAVPIGTMVLYGPADAVCIYVVSSLLSTLAFRRKMKLSTWVFNAGQYGIAAAAMVEVYSFTHVGTDYSLNWHVLWGVLFGAVAYTLVNHTFIHVLHMCRGTFDKSDIGQVLYEDGLITGLSMLPAFVMILVGTGQPLLAPVVILPMVLLVLVIRMYRQTAVMQSVHLVTARLASEFDVRRLCEEAARFTAELSMADAVVVFVYDEAKQVLAPKVAWPSDASVNFDDRGYRLEDGGVIWTSVVQNQWLYVPNILKDSRVKYDGFGDDAYRSMAAFPMVTRGSVQGAIVCYAERPYAFEDAIRYIEPFATQLSVLLENAKLYIRLHEQSSKDGATGLYNYRFFYEELAHRVHLGADTGNTVSIAIVDVDYFKKFNDTYGHLAGDAVLQSVGQILASLAGPEAVVARYGGEEFGIIFPYDADATYEKMEYIRGEVGRLAVDFEGYRLQGITISSGIANFPQHATGDRDLLLKADSAMYWGAKQRGRNRTAMYSPEFDAQLFVDELTGLYTYHFMNIRLREELQRGERNWGVICIDLEKFSYVNTAFGFTVGDRILKETSLIIKESLRQNELACRFGGDEFLVLIPSIPESELAYVAERLSSAIATHRFRGGSSVTLTLRAHITTQGFADVEDSIELFDQVGRQFAEMHHEHDESLA